MLCYVIHGDEIKGRAGGSGSGVLEDPLYKISLIQCWHLENDQHAQRIEEHRALSTLIRKPARTNRPEQQQADKRDLQGLVASWSVA